MECDKTVAHTPHIQPLDVLSIGAIHVPPGPAEAQMTAVFAHLLITGGTFSSLTFSVICVIVRIQSMAIS